MSGEDTQKKSAHLRRRRRRLPLIKRAARAAAVGARLLPFVVGALGLRRRVRVRGCL